MFFFKQKTPYEMRISDLSSDVCSSDRKLRLNTVDPTRMNTTKHDSLVVVSMACLSSASEKRPREMAMIKAPTAPMAPPSVGVATPMKMVPSTRKIRKLGSASCRERECQSV